MGWSELGLTALLKLGEWDGYFRDWARAAGYLFELSAMSLYLDR